MLGDITNLERRPRSSKPRASSAAVSPACTPTPKIGRTSPTQVPPLPGGSGGRAESRLPASPSIPAPASMATSETVAPQAMLKVLRGRRPLGGWFQFRLVLAPLLCVRRLAIPQWRSRIRFCNDGLREAYSATRLLQLTGEFPEIFVVSASDGSACRMVGLRFLSADEHSPLCPRYCMDVDEGDELSCHCAYLACSTLYSEDASTNLVNQTVLSKASTARADARAESWRSRDAQGRSCLGTMAPALAGASPDREHWHADNGRLATPERLRPGLLVNTPPRYNHVG